MAISGFLIHALPQFIEFHAQTVAQGAFRSKLVEQMLSLLQHLGCAWFDAEQTTPSPRNLLFSKQSSTSLSVEPKINRSSQPR
jgi:hypothetical protein